MPKVLLSIVIICSVLVSVRALAAENSLKQFSDDGVERDFVLPDLKNKARAFTDYRGKVVLVNFWATWCPSCIYEMPSFKRLARIMQNKPFEIIAINVGEPRFKVWKFLKTINFDLTTLLDNRRETFTNWQARVLPTSYLIDKQGSPRYYAVGSLEWDSEQITSVIEELLDDQPE